MDYRKHKIVTDVIEHMGLNQPIIIIGMHRSGTSLIAKLVSELGVHIGVKLDNHNESECFKRINQTLLHDHGACWSDPDSFVSRLVHEEFVDANARRALELLYKWRGEYGYVEAGSLWGWKDPRNTLTLPVWYKLFPNAKIIHVVRNGLAVAFSLRKRDLTSWLLGVVRGHRGNYERLVSPTIVPAYRLWENYLRIGLELESLYDNWLNLKYEEIVSQSRNQIKMMSDFLGIEVNDEMISSLGEEIIRRPRKRSWMNRMEARLLFKLCAISPDMLVELGYRVGEIL